MPSLEHRQRAARRIALSLTAACAAALIWAALSDLAHPPDYALRSELIWWLERAFVAVALLMAPAFTIVRLLAGELPTGMSTTGIVWGGDGMNLIRDIRELETAIETHQRLLDELQTQVEEVGK
jgi:hypothetical protein